LGLVYAWASLSAESMMSRVVNGASRPVTELMADADSAVRRFPIDPYLRGMRRYVREEIGRIPKE
jgi:hypothetical protein